MDKQQTIHKLSTLCKVLAVAVSGFNSARKGAISARENEDQCLCMHAGLSEALHLWY